MSDLLQYFYAQEHTRAEREHHNYAGATLELAQIKERLAELKSQHEPLAGLIEKKMGERERLYSAAFYIVAGRFPENEPTP